MVRTTLYMDGAEYVICDEIASGGMATVHLGRRLGAAGFARVVAIKRLYPQLARDDELAEMFRDEARLTARVRHANVVPVLDVVQGQNELYLVMEYVHGESLARLLRAERKAGTKTPPDVAVAIAIGVLEGLHAAHEARGDDGEPLGIVHRDVSPQNVLVAADGAPRLLDFGVAKAAGKFQGTRAGVVKGKVAYMAPEQLLKDELDRRTDVYAAGVVLWEVLTGERLFDEDTHIGALARGSQKIDPPSEFAGSPTALDPIVLKALAAKRSERYETAHAMAQALEAAHAPASPSKVAAWVAALAGPELAGRAERVAKVERGEATGTPLTAQPSAPAVAAPARGLPGFTIPAAIILSVVAAAGFFAWRAESSTPTPLPAASASAPAPPPPAPTPIALPTAAVVTAPPPPVTAPTARPPRPRPRNSAAAKSCDPPYTLDPNGIHIPKPECL